jgi:hypothetical protein
MQLTIDGRKVELSQIPAKEGWKTLHFLGSVIGPSFSELAAGSFASAIDLFFKNCSADDLYDFIEKMAPKVVVDDGKLNLNEYGFVVKCMKALIEYNYEDFFSPIQDVLDSMTE